MSIAPRITKDSNGRWDFKMTNGIFEMAEDGTQAAQHALQRLLVFRGEQSLNGALTEKTELGTKWFETIFKADKTKAEKELEIKTRILDTPGVKRILRFEWSQTGHVVTMEGAVLTDWGEEDVSQEITLL